ncbi:MAG TPA: DUF4350 domain-containing protein [Chitinophagaceae bacterium]|nr:DUF4350 domain-containing protein [Chitinophagaceae bacterium]
MKKVFIYIIIGAGLIAVLALVFSQQQKQQFDRTVTLDRKYKKPYDLAIAYSQLPLLFNNATTKVNRASPRDWFDTDSSADGKTLFFVVTRHFNPNVTEMRYLLDFVKQGNQVFISTPYMNDDAKQYFALGEDGAFNFRVYDYYRDSGTTYLKTPPFTGDSSFLNPGFNYSTHFTDVDSQHYYILSRNEDGYPDLVKVNVGKGSFYFHSNPFLFANYFLLWHNNITYLEKIASLIPPDKNKIIWDEYFVYRLSDNDRGQPPSPFHVLFSVSAFRWALIIGLVLLLLYVLLGVKLLQRLVPAWEKPKNETLDFTKTIGRLYFAKGDNTNLAKKMATYMLDFIRNKYFISTAILNEDFIKSLSSKSGYNEDEMKKVVGHLVYIQADHSVSEEQLAEIYEAFSKFYKYTS